MTNLDECCRNCDNCSKNSNGELYCYVLKETVGDTDYCNHFCDDEDEEY